MARLIEVQDVRNCPSPLRVSVGDVLLFHAAGGHVRSGDDVIELLGAFLSAVVGDNGHVLTPMGLPNTILFRVLKPGQALIDVVMGEPFHAAQTTALNVSVES